MNLMDKTSADALRDQILSVARKHKASWIELGQLLYTVYKDKHFRFWGFMDFQTYCIKELHLKTPTAMKILKSYYYLEAEKPELVDGQSADSTDPLPHYESVNMLRLASKNEKLTRSDVDELRHAVLSEGKEPKEVRAQMKQLLSEREEKDPAEVRQERRNSLIKRTISTLSSVKKEMEAGNLLPGYLLKQMNELIEKLADQVE